MNWQIPRIWENGEVWIMGGGPSVPQQFGIPEKVIQNVVKGNAPPSVYAPYMEAIRNKHIIGINVAYLLGDWIDMIFFGDMGFFLNHQEGLKSFAGIKVSCHPQINNYNWVKYIPKDPNWPKGITQNPSMLSWNGNSGAAAISIAAHAGAKRIVLLGFDMKLDESKKQHWHDLYGRLAVTSDPNKRGPYLPFDRHLRGFPCIAKDAKKMGIEIINCSPESAINEFKKVNVKDIL